MNEVLETELLNMVTTERDRLKRENDSLLAQLGAVKLAQYREKIAQAKGVTAFFLQHAEHMDIWRGPRNPGGGFQMQQKLHTEFRCWIRTDDSFGEAEEPVLEDAIRNAFKRAKLECPI